MASSNRDRAAQPKSCPDCESDFEFSSLREFFSRRDFMKAAGATALAAGAFGLPTAVASGAEKAAPAAATSTAVKGAPESLVKQLYRTLSPEQKKVIAFDWDYVDKDRGLLR